MPFKTLVFLIIFSFGNYFLIAQSGPGGVGGSSSILTWLDASTLGFSNGNSVGVWTDNSGNGNSFGQANASSKPTFLTNQINGLPALDFDGGDLLILPPASDFDNQSDLSWFIVAETDATSSAQNLLSTTYAGGSAASFKWNSLFRSGKHEEYIKNDNGSYVSRTTNGVNTSPVIRSVALTGSSTDVMTRYVNGLLTHTASISPFSVGFHNGSTIGRNSTTGNWYLDGRIAEIVIFNDALNVSQIKIINNHLSTKYGIAVSNDLYSFDGTHPNELAGIGQESSTDNHTDAQGTGIVRISTPSSLNDGDYMLWGHNDGALASQTSEFPAALISAGGTRLTREWVADITNGNVGTVTMQWDISGFSLGAMPSRYRIMVDDDGDFSNGVTLSITPTGTTTLTFTGADLYTNGPYFTLVYSGDDCLSVNVFSTDDWTDGPGGIWDCGNTPDSAVDVTISGLTTIQVSGTQSCNNLLVETDATLQLSAGATLIVKGDVDLQSGATITCDAASTIIFRRNDGSIQLVDNSTGGTVTFGNVTAAAANNVRFFGGSFAHTGGLSLNKALAQNTGSWTFVSNASGTAHVSNVGSGTISGGSYTIQRFIGGRAANWGDVSNFGLSGMTIEDMDDNIFISGITGGDGNAAGFVSMWRFDNSSDSYVAPTNTSEVMSLGTNGYETWLADDPTTWTAKQIDATRTGLNLSSTNISINGVGGGWNLIGNPFPGFLNWGDIKGTYSIVGNAFWYYDADSAQYNFRSGNTFIPPGQGFWVNTSSSYTMTLTTAMLRSDLNNSQFFKSEPLDEFKIEVKDKDEIFGSAIRVRKDEFAFAGVDELDIPPLKVPDARAINMWMDYAGDEMMVNYINPEEQHVEIPVVIEGGLPGEYTMNFKGLSKFRDFQCMNLYNEQTGDQIEISSGTHYTIKIDEDLAAQHFKILLSKQDYEDCMAPTDLSEEQLQVFATNKTIVADFFLDRSAIANINVYDVLGNLIYTAQETVGYSRENIDLNHVPGGVYFINIDVNGTVKSEKVILQ